MLRSSERPRASIVITAWRATTSPWASARMWDDVVHTCGHQRLFCSEECVSDWLRATGAVRGYVLGLPELWRLAAHWYEGRLDRGYVRREPSEAREYLRGVGLSGSFWGL